MNTSWDFDGVQEAGDYKPFPPGVYRLAVLDTEDKETGNGDPGVIVTIKVTDGPYRGKRLRDFITFMQPTAAGAGFAKHWLRVINQPYEGHININTARWKDQQFAGRVGLETYKTKAYPPKTREKNVLEESWNLKDEDIPPYGSESPAQRTVDEQKPGKDEAPKGEEVPF